MKTTGGCGILAHRGQESTPDAHSRRDAAGRQPDLNAQDTTGKNGGGTKYPPDAYEAPRQQTPQHTPPPPHAARDEPCRLAPRTAARALRHPTLADPAWYAPRGMAKEEKVEFEGEVVEALPNAMFRVKLDNDHMVLGHVAGKMRRFRIRILPGDRVRVELSPYDLDRARIVYRHR